jgi:hypothetical protein
MGPAWARRLHRGAGFAGDGHEAPYGNSLVGSYAMHAAAHARVRHHVGQLAEIAVG